MSIITPEDVLFVPQLRVNLFSVRKLGQADFIPVHNEEHGKIIIREHFRVCLSYPLEYNSARVGAWIGTSCQTSACPRCSCSCRPPLYQNTRLISRYTFPIEFRPIRGRRRPTTSNMETSMPMSRQKHREDDGEGRGVTDHPHEALGTPRHVATCISNQLARMYSSFNTGHLIGPSSWRRHSMISLR